MRTSKVGFLFYFRCFYNNHRMKQKLNWKSPVQFRKAAQKAA
ncbi:IS3 family transposase [Enterococcus raffinosus]